jgi:capsular polysaccharide biosynthesis protein
MVGAVLGTGLVFLLEFMDDSWRSPEEAEQVSGVPTFGVIPSVSEGAKSGAEILVRDANRGKGS